MSKDNLHSTMFLLIPKVPLQIRLVSTIFTFHNVSINTHPSQLLILHA